MPDYNVSILRTALIDADDIEDGFEAPELNQVVIGRDIAIFYEAEVPVRDGRYEAVVMVGLQVLPGHHASMMIYRHEGSAAGETTRIIGHHRQPTDDFLPEELRVSVSVAEEMPAPQERKDSERIDVQIIQPTDDGVGESKRSTER